MCCLTETEQCFMQSSDVSPLLAGTEEARSCQGRVQVHRLACWFPADVSEPCWLCSPTVGSSRRSALKRGGQLLTTGSAWCRPMGVSCGAAQKQKGGGRGHADLHAWRRAERLEITYSRPPGWLWQSLWAPSPPGRAWLKSRDSFCSEEGDLETTLRL